MEDGIFYGFWVIGEFCIEALSYVFDVATGLVDIFPSRRDDE
jgi:hypothetical protein